MKLETHAIHEGALHDKSFGSVAMPLILSTTFERNTEGGFDEGRDIYSRASNPNRRALEAKLAVLENGVEAIAFSSGQAATMSVFNALQPNSHVIIPDDIYYGTRVLLETIYKRWGLTFSAIDMTNISTIKKAITNKTKLIWIESPSNPSFPKKTGRLTGARAIALIVPSARKGFGFPISSVLSWVKIICGSYRT